MKESCYQKRKLTQLPWDKQNWNTTQLPWDKWIYGS